VPLRRGIGRVGWIDRFLGRRENSSAGGGPTAAGSDVLDSPVVAWEARRLARHIESSLAFPGERNPVRHVQMGEAVSRLAPHAPFAPWCAYRALLARNQIDEALTLARDQRQRAEARSQRDLLESWLCTAMDPARRLPHHSRAAAEWIAEPTRTPSESAVGLACFNHAVGGVSEDYHPVRGFLAVVELAPWDSDALRIAARPVLADLRKFALIDQTIVCWHLFRVTGDDAIGIELADRAAAAGAAEQSIMIRSALARRAVEETTAMTHMVKAAEIAVMAGRYHEAMELARPATAPGSPTCVFASYLTVHSLRLLGRGAESATLIENMRREYERLGPLKSHPDERRHLFRHLLWFHGNFDPDEREIDRLSVEAMSFGLDTFAVARARGACAFRKDSFARAAELLTPVLRADPRDHDAGTLLVRALMTLGRIDEARTFASSCLAANPTSDHRAELELLLEGTGGTVPAYPQHLVETGDFLREQSWDYLSSMGSTSDITLEIIDLHLLPGLDESPSVTVRLTNKGRTPIPLAAGGSLGARLFLYGQFEAFAVRVISFGDLVNRTLDEFVAIGPGQSLDVPIDLDISIQAELLLMRSRLGPCAGWVIAALVPQVRLLDFDRWWLSIIAPLHGSDGFCPPERVVPDFPIARFVSVSPVRSVRFPDPEDVANLIASGGRELVEQPAEAAYLTIRRLHALLGCNHETLLQQSWKDEVLVRLEAVASSHPHPIVRAVAWRTVLEYRRPFPWASVEIAARDPHWYVRLMGIYEIPDDAQFPADGVRRLADDADDLVRRAFRHRLAPKPATE
jgi:tetratricopeptide (TPR) repeat protein